MKELCKGYDHKDILNMDESRCFFKALPIKGLAQKGKKSKVGRKSKQKITISIFVIADGAKVGKPTVTCWSKKHQGVFHLLVQLISLIKSCILQTQNLGWKQKLWKQS